MPKKLQLSHKINLTPVLKNTIHLLSMPYPELLGEINNALEKNIVLTEKTPYLEGDYQTHANFDQDIELQIESKEFFLSNLENQLANSSFDFQETAIARIIFENLSEEGFLEINTDIVKNVFSRQHPTQKINTRDCEKVRRKIQMDFEPFGVASFNVQDFLLLQVGQLQNIKHTTLICKLLLGKINIDDVSTKQRSHFLAVIKKLSKTPNDNAGDDNIQYIQTDITIENNANEWQISLRSLPSITLNKTYLSLRSKIKDKSLFNEHLMAARGLIDFVNYRHKLLQRVAGALTQKQSQALKKGLTHLQPLSQKQLALELNIGESSLSRLLKEKYVDTPIGVIPIKDLFSSSVNNHASKSIKKRVQTLIKKEDKPLSDQKIADLLMQKNINISRRTVTKYRQALHLPCAANRRKLK